MGLLEKATRISEGNISTIGEATKGETKTTDVSLAPEEEKDSKVKGERDDDGGGLLARAEALKESEKTMEIEGGAEPAGESVLNADYPLEEGLLKKAESMAKEEVLEVTEGREAQPTGLLKKALRYAGEEEEVAPGASEEAELAEEEKEIAEKVEEKGEAESEEEKIFSEELFTTKELIEEEASKIEEEISEESTARVEYPEAEIEKVVPEEEAPAGADYFSLLKKLIASEDINELIKKMDNIIYEEGFKRLSEVILDILVSVSGGAGGAIYTLDGNVFTPSIFSTNLNREIKNKYSILKAKIKKTEKLTGTFIDIAGPILSKDKKAESIIDAINNLNKLKSWLILPFVSHGVVFGFALIVDISEKKRFPRKQVSLLGTVFKDKLALDVLENTVVKSKDELKTFREQQKLLDSVRKNILEKKADFKLAFKDFCDNISADIASLVLNLDGYYEVISTKGISPESTLRYGVSKVKSKINSILKKKKVVQVKDIKPEQFGLVGEDAKKTNILILAPILYQGEPLGALIIHRFMYKIKKLTPELTTMLKSSTEYLLPLLMWWRLKRTSPADIIADSIGELIKWSDKNKKRIVFFSIRFEGIYEKIQKIGLKKYMAIYADIKRLNVLDIADKKGVTIFLYPDRLAVGIKEGTIDFDEYRSNLEESFDELIKSRRSFKDLKLKIDSGVYPAELKNLSDVFNFLDYNG